MMKIFGAEGCGTIFNFDGDEKLGYDGAGERKDHIGDLPAPYCDWQIQRISLCTGLPVIITANDPSLAGWPTLLFAGVNSKIRNDPTISFF